MRVKIYLDAAPIIYLVEGNEQFKDEVLQRAFSDEVHPVTCGISITECMSKPYAEGNETRLRAFREFFATQLDEIISLTASCFEFAAQLRGQHRLNSADAIHLAAAIRGGCHVFLTNDHRLKSVTLIDVQVLTGGTKQ